MRLLDLLAIQVLPWALALALAACDAPAADADPASPDAPAGDLPADVVDDEVREVVDASDAIEETEATETADVASEPLAACAPALAWFSEETGPDFVYGSPALTVSPGGRLLARRDPLGDLYVRMRDGARLGHDVREASGPLDAAWERRLVAVDGGRVELRDVASDQVLHTFDELEGAGWSLEGRSGSPGLALLEGEGLAVARSCWYVATGDERVTVTAWRLDDGSQAWQVTRPGSCSLFSWIESPWVLSAGPGRLLTADAASSTLWVLSTADGATLAEAAVTTPGGEPPPRGSWMGEALLAVAVRPDGAEVAVTTPDGWLVRRALPQLTAIGEPRAVAVAPVNLQSYGPSVESPLAWSPAGNLLAHVGTDGQVALLDLDSGEDGPALPSPLPTEDGPLFPPGTPNSPAALAFLPEGGGLLVAHERGVALWTCPGHATVVGEPEPVAVTLTLPATTVPAGALEARVSVSGGRRPRVVTLLVGDAPADFAATLGDTIATWVEAGSPSLAARVDDGLSSATSPAVALTVSAPR